MKASYDWIRSYVPDWTGTPEEMAEKLTFSGTEVEEVEPVGDDHVLEVGVTSNRVDSLCHLGLAREVAALTGTVARIPDHAADHAGGATSDVTGVTVEDEGACPRFTARVIEGVRVGPSPDWLRKRVETLGMRPVNNVVDVTNFVLHELNQPLHAYDLDLLREQRIVVRRARPGERLQAINDRAYDLTPEDLVIADAEVPVGIAGVMGGLETEVSEKTTRLLLESAYFSGPVIRQTSRRLLLASDASYRFERGIDRRGVLEASERAAALLLEVCGGTLRRDPIDIGGPGPEPAPVRLRLDRITRVCGVEVPRERTVAILRALVCGVAEDGAEALVVTPPSFRADLTREIDLVEEVIRVHGLHHLPVEAGMPIAPVHDHPARTLRERIKDRMVSLGYVETVTPNFVREGTFADVSLLTRGTGVSVQNPVRKGEGALRRSMLPSLLVVRKHNQDHGNEGVRVFELGNVHARVDDAVDHVPVMGWLTDGDLRDARGVAEEILGHAGISATVEPVQRDHLEPGSAGRIVLGDETLGYFGRPAAPLLKAAGLKARPSYGELDLGRVRAHAIGTPTFRGMPRFPGVVRDLAVILAEERPYRDLEEAIEKAGLSWLESLELFDVFRGKEQIGAGRKQLAVRLSFRWGAGTLTSEQVDSEVARLVELLREGLGAEIRGA